jgi:hypothetical protein
MTLQIMSIASIHRAAEEHARAAHNISYSTSCPYPLGSAAAETYATHFNAMRERIAIAQLAQQQAQEIEGSAQCQA